MSLRGGLMFNWEEKIKESESFPKIKAYLRECVQSRIFITYRTLLLHLHVPTNSDSVLLIMILIWIWIMFLSNIYFIRYIMHFWINFAPASLMFILLHYLSFTTIWEGEYPIILISVKVFYWQIKYLKYVYLIPLNCYLTIFIYLGKLQRLHQKLVLIHLIMK